MTYRDIVARLKSRFREEDGQALVEYGLLLALIAVVCIGIVTTLGIRVSGTFQSVSSVLPKAGN